jgi:hypothetical protein
MGIQIRQPGDAAAAAKAGTAIGQAQKRERAEEEAFALQRQQMAINAQRAATERAMEFELQKMEMRSQQAFMHEMRLEQAELDKEARAREWAVEKMEMASRLDFEREEKDRQLKMDRITNQLDRLDKEVDEGRLDPNNTAYKSKKFNLEAQLSAADAGISMPGFVKEPKPDDNFGVMPWYMRPEYIDTPEGMAARTKAERLPNEPQEFGIEPYWRHPDLINTPHGQAMLKKSEEGTRRPPSIITQKHTADAITGIENYGVEEIQEMSADEIRNSRLTAGMSDQDILELFPNIPGLAEKFAGTPKSAAQTVGGFSVGQIVTRGGKKLRIVELRPDGNHRVEVVE